MISTPSIIAKRRDRLPPVLFLLLCAFIYAGLDRLPEPSYAWINAANARLAAGLLQLCGYDPRVNGTFLTLEGFTVQVIGECSAVFISVLLIAFVLSTPSPWTKKIPGLAGGCLLLLIINILRIAVVTWTGAFHPTLFEISHVYLGQVILILTLLLFCLGWSLWSREKSTGLMFKNALLLFSWSLLLFAFWMLVHKYYYRLLLDISDGLLALFQLDIRRPDRIRIFPHTFVTFNSVIIGSLFCVARKRLQRPALVLFFWLVLLFSLHLSLYLSQQVFFATQDTRAFTLTNISLKLNEWLVPFGGFWYFLLRKRG